MPSTAAFDGPTNARNAGRGNVPVVRAKGLNRIAWMFAFVYAANAWHYGWRPSTRTTIDDVLAFLTVGALLLLYWMGYRALQHQSEASWRGVVLPAIPLVALSFITIPYDSTDVFFYMDVGWAQTHYGMNPYTQVLRDIPNSEKDPMIRPDWMKTDKNPWLDLPMVYGFLFAVLVKVLAWAGHGYWWLTLAFFKGINVAAYAVCCRILWLMSKAAGSLRPDLPVYLFAWSPLVLQHFIANAHNDLIVGCGVLVATYLLSSRQYASLAPAALVAVALIKYVTVPLVFISLWLVARQRGHRQASLALMVCGIVILLSASPYIGELRAFRLDLISAQLNKVTAGSLDAFVFYLYRTASRWIVPPSSIETFGFLLKMLLWSIGAFVIAVEAVAFFRKCEPSLDDWIATSSRILFVIIFIISSQFYSWYIGMFLPLTLMLRSEDWLRSFSISLNGAHLFSLTSISRKGIGYFLLTLFPALIRTS